MKISVSKTAVVLFTFIFVWTSIWLSVVYFGWKTTWKSLYLPTSLPVFLDMRTVQGSLFSIEDGFDPQLTNPGDPLNRVMNYPLIWVEIAEFFQLNNEINFLLFTSSCIIAYLICCFLLLRDFPSFYILIAMFSGASLLAVERGNNDLIVFTLLFIGIYTSQDYVRYSTFLLAAVLKIYPTFAILTFAKKSRELFILAFLIIAYFAYIGSELKMIQSGNSALGSHSYGLINVFRWISSHGISSGAETTIIVLVVPASLLFVITLTKKVHVNQPEQRTHEADLFITGGAIFTFTYLVTCNWDYRLIFLLFCIPYILSIKNNLVRRSTLISILISLNITIGMNFLTKYIEFISMLSKYYLFLVIFACLLNELNTILYSYSFFPHFTPKVSCITLKRKKRK